MTQSHQNSAGIRRFFLPRWLANVAWVIGALGLIWFLLPVFLSESFVVGLHHFNQSTSVVFTLLRWACYAIAIALGPRLIEKKRKTPMTDADKKHLRWMLVRVFFIYDVIFAFDLFGWRS
jgi:hypothetical protein